MKWFRSNIRNGARLALFALFVQFALIVRPLPWLRATAAPHRQSSPAAPQSSIAGDSTATPGLAEAGHPASHDRDQPGHDDCAICAVVAMAGTVLFATPPILLLPEAVELLYRTTDAEFIHLESAGTAFQPRAPPAS